MIVKHNDTGHPHLHIVANRVSHKGELVNDQFCKNRTAQACDQLEKEFDLTVAKEQKRSRQSQLDKRQGVKKDKTLIKREVNESLARCKSIEDLKKSLERKQIALREHKRADGTTFGISFKKNDFSVKGTAIDLKYKDPGSRARKEQKPNTR